MVKEMKTFLPGECNTKNLANEAILWAETKNSFIKISHGYLCSFFSLAFHSFGFQITRSGEERLETEQKRLSRERIEGYTNNSIQ